MRSRKLIILLIIIVAMLIIALGVAIVYVVLQRKQGAENQIVSNVPRYMANNETGADNNSTTNTVNDTTNNTNTTNNVNNTTNNTVNNTTNSTNNNAVANANQNAISTFNEMFTSYTGTAKTGTQVLTLLSIIENNNSTNTAHKVNLTNTGNTPVDANNKYKVTLSYDTEGYVNNVEIKEYTETEEDIEKARFNNQFISFDENGEITGENIVKLINLIQESNETNPEHQITPKTNTSLGMADIVDTETYLIQVLDSDDNKDGWVDTVVLDKKM